MAFAALLALPAALQEVHPEGLPLDLTRHPVGFLALAAFTIAYATVILEERLHLRKSIPVIIAAGVIWALIGAAYVQAGIGDLAAVHVRESLGEYAELFLFILTAMTFVNTMEERQVFDALRAWLVSRGLSFRQLFWVTGLMSFFLSSQLDNLTTALVMGTVSITVGRGNPKFIALACVNTVVAANAGGAWSAFGDITTLMVWQAGRAEFFDFYRIFVPSIVNWVIPAFIMSFAVPKERPPAVEEKVAIRRGGLAVVGLFALTIVMAVSFYNLMDLPPVLGMMTGLGFLKLYGYLLTRRTTPPGGFENAVDRDPLGGFDKPARDSFDIFDILRRAEWDTLLFFFGIIVSVGGLATIGYLGRLSAVLYGTYGPVPANIAVGVMSAIVDNIPVMYAVLNMNPAMDLHQWLLVTLTAGVGGSMLSIGSAAGVALMGQAYGTYTFFSHLRWSWAIALGYAGSIWVHLLINP